MRVLVGLLALFGLLAMQVHSLAPHHHHGEHRGFHTHRGHDGHAFEVDSSSDELPPAITDDHHHHWHGHWEEANTKSPREMRLGVEDSAVLHSPHDFIVERACDLPVRISHPMTPFQTGPPGSILSRGPPVA